MNIFEVNAKLEELAEKKKDSFSLEENKLKTLKGISRLIHGIRKKDKEEIYLNIGLAYTTMFFGKDTVEKLDLDEKFFGVFQEGLEMNGNPEFRKNIETSSTNFSRRFAVCNLESLREVLVHDGYNFHFCFGLVSSMLSVATMFDVDFVHAIEKYIGSLESINAGKKERNSKIFGLEDELPDGDILLIIFDDKCVKKFIEDEYEKFEPWNFQDVLNTAKESGYKEGVITVIVEGCRNGHVYTFGNYDTEKFHQVGTTQGYA